MALEHVAIVAMGSSVNSYIQLAASAGGPHGLWDEVWAISAMGGVIQHDRAFVMHDFKDTEAHVTEHDHAAPMLAWMKTHPGPLYTSRAYEEFPGSVAFPLTAVINAVGFAYFNTSVAYALGLAIHLKVKRIGLYGCDFTYPDNHAAEKGRACCEFLIARAMGKQISVSVPSDTTLLDANVPHERRFYGYTEAPVLEHGGFEAKHLVGMKGRV